LIKIVFYSDVERFQLVTKTILVRLAITSERNIYNNVIYILGKL